MRTRPLKNGEVDAKQLSPRQNLARLKLLVKSLEALIASESTHAAIDVCWEMSNAAWAIREQLVALRDGPVKPGTSLTRVRKETA